MLSLSAYRNHTLRITMNPIKNLVIQLLCLLLLNPPMNATMTEKIVQNIRWDGVTAYLPVDRYRIQERLDAWRASNEGASDAPRLYLPETPVFPNLLDESQHVVYIDVGQIDFYDFKDYPDKSVSVNGLEFAVVIPLLTDDPKGYPKYSLALSKFYQRDRGDFPKPNIAFPYIPVDELSMTDTGAIIRNGSDELRLSFERFVDPCLPSPSVIRQEFNEFVDQEFKLGVPEPNFSFCDTHPYDNHYCSTARQILDEVLLASPNICQNWKSLKRSSCTTSLKVENITDGFRDFLLIGDGPVQVVASESIYEKFTIGLKYPCLE